MSNEIKYDRRMFLNHATLSLAGGLLTVGELMPTATDKVNHAAKSHSFKMSNSSFADIKQINAGVLNIGYVDEGPTHGPVVILLHGWPYDIHSFADVTHLLVAAGYRVIIPYLRGYGTTRFLSDTTIRNGQQSVFAIDTIALMDALKIQKAT
jgi:hypothetical protein